MIYYPVIGFIVASCIAVYLYYRLVQKEKSFKTSESEDLEIERAINYFSNSLIVHNTPEEILWDITKNCISALNFEDCIIYLLDEEKNVFIQKAAFGPKNPSHFEILHPIEIRPGEGIVGTVGVTGKAEIIPDTTLDPRYIIDDDQRYSEITVPIIYQGKVIGVIDSEHSAKNFFREKHLRILSNIASLCANKIKRLELEMAYRQAEMKLNENKLRIAQNKLTALRMQMNPDFFCNSLNSIHDYISVKDIPKASAYISKFSKLISHIFNNAQSEWITIEKEIKTIKLYIDLEKIRFEKDFKVTIHVSPDICQDAVLIPNLLMQPFVENSIWHGLLNKEDGEGELSIRYWSGIDKIYMSVEDNGVGMSFSNTLKSGTTLTLEKPGLKITRERIRIMNEVSDAGITFSVTDLQDENGNSKGTRAFISLRLKSA
jgi:putative methionine-R-sulfoxide reductase with GAF domain